MSWAWTTILIIALLLPGAAFLSALAKKDHFTKDIIKANAVGEIATALLVSGTLHLIAWLIFQGLVLMAPEMPYPTLTSVFEFYDGKAVFLKRDLELLIVETTVYVIALSIVGYGAGLGVARVVQSGRLTFLASHPWANDLRPSSTRVVTAYVMTNMSNNNKVLMYRGLLRDFRLNSEGKFSYIVLSSANRFIMDFGKKVPQTYDGLSLFDDEQVRTQDWNYIAIDGGSIANVAFAKSARIQPAPGDEAALEDALRHLANDPV
ncbi:hypothetical protein [Azorhizobium sp. AG788]|uniref:hypothetical protein n=1 Tax=Azorhizobium sp. AG788 TaxID=2183897 RepID=UPI0031394F25